MLVISVTNNKAGSFDPITVKESYSQTGGLPAGHKVLTKAGLDNSNIDLFEINAALGSFLATQKRLQQMQACSMSYSLTRVEK